VKHFCTISARNSVDCVYINFSKASDSIVNYVLNLLSLVFKVKCCIVLLLFFTVEPSLLELVNITQIPVMLSAENRREAYLGHFLANVHVRYMLSPSVCRLSVCRVSSITFVHLLRRLKFSAMFLRHLVHWPSVIFDKILRRSSQGNPSVRGGVVKPKRGSQI